MRALAFAVSAACGSPCATAKAVAISAMHIIDNNRVVIRVVAKKLLLSAYCLLLTVFWWRRRELNPDPKANAEGLYMLICFSFHSLLRERVLPGVRLVKQQDPKAG